MEVEADCGTGREGAAGGLDWKGAALGRLLLTLEILIGWLGFGAVEGCRYSCTMRYKVLTKKALLPVSCSV